MYYYRFRFRSIIVTLTAQQRSSQLPVNGLLAPTVPGSVLSTAREPGRSVRVRRRRRCFRLTISGSKRSSLYTVSEKKVPLDFLP